ncbi:MAG: hypothetical protein A2928_02095 [Candidatus Taylorbacteria bacterium RIFCSPLOWO2_01_FULL_45_15b]|uniref:Uncharacterized protein n=1 Tax=Candidatus Taylorbacteria bacterium RIFCSPLOWO2_01_FULL_45_15b TaxID=1802319 RepID=A0A1G2N716_9BACT|nr:MAG: hypothetical protein A2928_02095 [Candidatus Taylorbacteria bacterium RIFCSPLOWO2_01_FULL_45_15b]
MEKELLEEIRAEIKIVRKIEEENGKTLRALKRSLLYGRVYRVIYWIVLIGLGVFGYYSIQPYIDNVLDLYQKASLF